MDLNLWTNTQLKRLDLHSGSRRVSRNCCFLKVFVFGWDEEMTVVLVLEASGTTSKVKKIVPL